MKLHYCQAAHVKSHGLDVLYDQMKNEVDVCKGIRLDCRIPVLGMGFKVERTLRGVPLLEILMIN